MARKRQVYAGYAPVFWRPAEGVAGLHEQFLRRQVLSEATVALRTRHGFIICERRPSEALVDDFTVAPPGTWGTDGAALLLAAAGRLAAGGISAVRVVTAHADRGEFLLAPVAQPGRLPVNEAFALACRREGPAVGLAEGWDVRPGRPQGRRCAAKELVDDEIAVGLEH